MLILAYAPATAVGAMDYEPAPSGFAPQSEPFDSQPSPDVDRAADLPDRELILHPGYPEDVRDSCVALWFSLNEAYARANDHLGVRAGWDTSLARRAGLTLAAFWLAAGSAYYSHEMGHNFVLRDNYDDEGFTIDWSSCYQGLWPAFDRGPPIDLFVMSYEENFKHRVDGLNQNACDAFSSWRRSVTSGTASLHDWFWFLTSKMECSRYIVHVGLGDNRPAWS